MPDDHRRIRQIVEQRLQLLVEERQPVLHAGEAPALAHRLVERIVAEHRAEGGAIVLAEAARSSPRSGSPRSPARGRGACSWPVVRWLSAIEGADRLQRIAEEIEADRRLPCPAPRGRGCRRARRIRRPRGRSRCGRSRSPRASCTSPSIGTTLPGAAVSARCRNALPVRHALHDGVRGGEDDARPCVLLQAARGARSSAPPRFPGSARRGRREGCPRPENVSVGIVGREEGERRFRQRHGRARRARRRGSCRRFSARSREDAALVARPARRRASRVARPRKRSGQRVGRREAAQLSSWARGMECDDRIENAAIGNSGPAALGRRSRSEARRPAPPSAPRNRRDRDRRAPLYGHPRTAREAGPSRACPDARRETAPAGGAGQGRGWCGRCRSSQPAYGNSDRAWQMAGGMAGTCGRIDNPCALPASIRSSRPPPRCRASGRASASLIARVVGADDGDALVRDLLFHLPSGSIDRRNRPPLYQMPPSGPVTVEGIVERIEKPRGYRRPVAHRARRRQRHDPGRLFQGAAGLAEEALSARRAGGSSAARSNGSTCARRSGTRTMC